MEDQESQDHLVPADPKNGRSVMINPHAGGWSFVENFIAESTA